VLVPSSVVHHGGLSRPILSQLQPSTKNVSPILAKEFLGLCLRLRLRRRLDLSLMNVIFQRASRSFPPEDGVRLPDDVGAVGCRGRLPAHVPQLLLEHGHPSRVRLHGRAPRAPLHPRRRKEPAKEDGNAHGICVPVG
jgi:hypothetical protein